MRVQYGLLAEATIEEALTSIADTTKRQQLGLRCGQMTHVCDCNFSDEDREWAAAYMTEFADNPDAHSNFHPPVVSGCSMRSSANRSASGRVFGELQSHISALSIDRSCSGLRRRIQRHLLGPLQPSALHDRGTGAVNSDASTRYALCSPWCALLPKRCIEVASR